MFTDPKLQSLIEQGLSSNIDLLSAALVVQEYQAQLTAARLAYVPSFTLAPSGELSWVQHGSLQKTYTLPLSASWEVDLFGKLLNSKRGAKAAWLQSEATLRAVRTQVISGIATRLLYVADARPSVGNHRADDRELESDRPDDESDEAGRQCQ